jgi:hypothetical protein
MPTFHVLCNMNAQELSALCLKYKIGTKRLSIDLGILESTISKHKSGKLKMSAAYTSLYMQYFSNPFNFSIFSRQEFSVMLNDFVKSAVQDVAVGDYRMKFKELTAGEFTKIATLAKIL